MRRTSAFTLVEIVASILLFSMGVMGVIAVIAHGLSTAGRAQGDATAWATALSVLKDPMPMGCGGEGEGDLRRWTWAQSGATWTASEEGVAVWRYTTWQTDAGADIAQPDMGDPQANNPAVFPPGGAPSPGCASGWLNGYYVERREQSRAADRIARGVRLVEVRVDVYWSGYVGADGKPLASLVDRYVRQDAP